MPHLKSKGQSQKKIKLEKKKVYCDITECKKYQKEKEYQVKKEEKINQLIETSKDLKVVDDHKLGFMNVYDEDDCGCKRRDETKSSDSGDHADISDLSRYKLKIVFIQIMTRIKKCNKL